MLGLKEKKKNSDQSEKKCLFEVRRGAEGLGKQEEKGTKAQKVEKGERKEEDSRTD